MDTVKVVYKCLNKKEKYIERNKENASGTIRKFPVHFLLNDG